MRLPANASATVEATFINANGLAVEVQGEVTWASSNEAIVRVEVDDEDDTMASLTAGPSAGSATVTAKADADLGEGVREVTATLDVVVIARGEAVGGEITPVGIDQGLPGAGGEGPDNSLPGGSGGRPDNALPGRNRPTDPGYGKPGGGGRPDNALPGDQPGAGNELPTKPGRPDQGLPDNASPKK
jgi:hypothetical protein